MSATPGGRNDVTCITGRTAAPNPLNIMVRKTYLGGLRCRPNLERVCSKFSGGHPDKHFLNTVKNLNLVTGTPSACAKKAQDSVRIAKYSETAVTGHASPLTFFSKIHSPRPNVSVLECGIQMQTALFDRMTSSRDPNYISTEIPAC